MPLVIFMSLTLHRQQWIKEQVEDKYVRGVGHPDDKLEFKIHKLVTRYALPFYLILSEIIYHLPQNHLKIVIKNKATV